MKNLFLFISAISFLFTSCDAQNKIGGNGFIPADYFKGQPLDPGSINTGWGSQTVFPDLNQDGYADLIKDLDGTLILDEAYTSVPFRVIVGTEIDKINGGTKTVYEIWEVMVLKVKTYELKKNPHDVIVEKSLAPLGGKNKNFVSNTKYQILPNYIYVKWGG